MQHNLFSYIFYNIKFLQCCKICKQIMIGWNKYEKCHSLSKKKIIDRDFSVRFSQSNLRFYAQIASSLVSLFVTMLRISFMMLI